MLDTLSRGELAWEFATILSQEARELEAAGVDIVQFDEPAAHICYGDGIEANNK